MFTHIYDEELNHIISLNYKCEEFLKTPKHYFPDWKDTFHASSTKFLFPILVDDKLQESSREDMILKHKKEDLLLDGEYVENGKIIKTEMPLNFLKPVWDRNSHTWEESITDEEMKNIKKGAIVLNASEFIPQVTGLKVDEDVQFISDKGTKKGGYAYLDKKVPNAVFKCIKQTDSTENNKEFFLDISLSGVIDNLDENYISKNKGGTINNDLNIDNSNGRNTNLRICYKNGKGVIYKNSEEFRFWNLKSDSYLCLYDNGDARFDASNLETNSKEVIAAINELNDNCLTYKEHTNFDTVDALTNANAGIYRSNNVYQLGEGYFTVIVTINPKYTGDRIIQAFNMVTYDSYIGGTNNGHWTCWRKVFTSDNFNPDTKLNTTGGTIAGDLKIEGTLNVDNSILCKELVSNNNVSAFSDKRLKKNIKKIENPLDKIEQLNGYTFEMNNKKQTGVIAQEVEKVLPEVIGKQGEYLTVAYGNMAGLFIESIKELKVEINSLKAEIKELKSGDK